MAGETPREAEELFAQLVDRFRRDPSVTLPSGSGEPAFGASTLKVDGKIFAMLAKGEMVVKLPRQRVDELIASRAGERFDPGHGRLMKEWAAISPRDSRYWAELAEEAREFVAAGAQARRR